MQQPVPTTTGGSLQPILSNQRSQSAKPSLMTLQNQRTIQSAMQRSPVIPSGQRVPSGIGSFAQPTNNSQRIQSGYTRIQSGQTRVGGTRIQSAAKSTRSIVKELFHIEPKEIIFEDIKTGILYEQILNVQNLAKYPVRIRVQQPKTSKFRADYDMQQGIAAGLGLKVLVLFKESERDIAALNQHQKPPPFYKDVIIIESDEFKVEVHLAAYRACPKLKFNEFIDFGFVQQGTENTKQLIIQNVGFADAKVQIKSDLLNLRAVPNLITIAPGEYQSINIVYKANEMGNFRQTMDIVSENLSQKLDIAACSVDYTRFLMDSKGSQVTSLDFGELYMGKTKIIKLKYVNNAPKGHQFKILTRRGIINPNDDIVNLQTPNELGIEQSEKLLVVQPSNGYIQAYSSIELSLICMIQITPKEHQLAKKICFGVDVEKEQMSREIKYSIIVQQPDEDLIAYTNVKALLPLVKISKQSLQFGDCDVNDNKDILFTISNLQNQPVEISFQKVSCFFFKPEGVTINGLSQTTVQVKFTPKNVGKYSQNIDMILNDYLTIPVKVNGEALKITKKRPQTRGPEARAEDFQIDPKFIDTKEIEYVKKRNNELIEQNHQPGNIVDGYFEDTQKKPKNTTQTNNFLQDSRNNRLEKQRQQIIQQRVETITKAQEKQRDEGSKPPKDYEFELGLQVDNMDNDIEIPYRKEGLYVVKPFQQYEPLKRQDDELVDFKPDPKQPVKRILSGRPQSHKQVRDVNRELTADDLKRIQAGPIKIDYGTIYINTPMSRTFFIHNNLRYAIIARLCIDKKEELRKTFQDPQVIDSGEEGQFEIIVQAQSLGQLKQTLRYILNEKHSFEIMVVANVETVKLEISKTTIKMQFNEDGGMTVSDSIKLSNNGVGPAQFNFIQPENSKFTLDCLNGIIQGQSQQIIQITYTPSKIMKDPQDPESDVVFKNQNPTRQDEEKIVLKVKDGSEIQLKCIGLVSDVKCVCKNTVEFQEICVAQEKSLPFQVKNTSRNNAIFKILTEYLPIGCNVIPASGKILPEENKEFTVKLNCDKPININTSILLMLRSGRVLRIPLTAQCIVPNVIITQQLFDFGDVTTLGNQTALPLTIVNKSNVEVKLILDLRNEDINPDANEGVGCLILKQQSELFKNYAEEEQQEESDDDLLSSARQKKKMICQNKKFILILSAQQTAQFQLHFYPKELKRYQFQLPIEIYKFGIIDTIKRMVQVQGCSPKFIVEPKTVEFPRKIILSPPEKNKPNIQEILLSNPEYKGMQFKIQIDADTGNIPSVFQVIPLAGRVDAGQTLRVKVMFNPRYEGTYSKQAQIYLEDSKPGQPYLIVQLHGIAAKPSVQFDRRELILCPVPLGIESRLQFKIFNDGFETQKLSVKQLEGFTVEFLDGQTVGITKQYLDMIIKYTAQNPISISQTLEIIDETQHSYSISVSATSDNCSFTTWMYDNQAEIALVKGVPHLTEINQTDESEDSKDSIHKKLTSTQQISEKVIESKCEHLQRWYNQFVGQLDIFPTSIILMQGHHIFELIQFLTGRTQFPFRAQLQNIKQKSQISQLLHQQYKELLLQLKVDGALLNQIRPCYLLSYEDYQFYLKTVDMKFTHPDFQKYSQQQFDLVSKTSYLILFTQILRIYYLPRVTLKAMRQINGSINEYPQSNVYSSQEMLILRWIELQATQYWKESKSIRIINFGMLKDAHILTAMLLSYLGPGGLKYFQPLGQITKQEQDCSRNMSIFLKGLQDIGIESHLVLNDCVNMSNPESLLMLMLLYTQVPNFMPKREPLMFKCVLGSIIMKTITLTNTTKEPIVYFVKLEGSSDFSIEEDQIKIEPGGKYNYNIKFTSRISDEQTALITFCNKKGNKNIAAAIVYELKGVISERVSQKIWTVSSVMYEMKEFSITVQNTFTNSEFGHFTISIVPIKVPLVIETPKKKKKAMSMAEKKKDADNELKEKQRLEKLTSIEFPPAFFCKQESIRLKRGAQYNLPMQYLPTQLHQQKCMVVFQDNSVGEFQYEIHGNVEPPEVLYDLKPDLQVFIDQVASFYHHVPFFNPQLKAALKQVDQLTIDKKKIINRQNSNSVTLQNKPNIPIDDIMFSVQLEEPQSYISCDKAFQLVNYQQLLLNQTKNSEDDDDPQQQLQKSDEKQNLIQFSMNFKTAVKDYLSHFMLVNETKTDVRRFRIQITSLPKPIMVTLEMTIPAREIVTQEIPIVNNTDRDFNLKINLVGDDRFSILGDGQSKRKKQEKVADQKDIKENSQKNNKDQDFHQQNIQREQLIKKKLNNQPTNGAVVVQFAPDWICDVKAKLSIINPLTNDFYEYLLIGKGEEPLSEGHYTIKAVARQPITQIIPVSNNTNDELRYSVETDVLNAAGEQEITIQPQTTYEYKLNINPVISGQFTGSITFTGNGHYRWWTIMLDTANPKPLGTVDLVSPIRKAIAFDIEIANPLPENVTYEVQIIGEALSGDSWFSVLPGGTSTYQLVFQPLQEGRWKGSISFCHPKMGEIWYTLNLIGEDRGGIKVPQFKTELGKLDKCEMLLENPTCNSIIAEIENSNSTNFSLEFEGGQQLILEPYTLKPVYVVFVPSALTAHSGEIQIKTKEIGKWIFLCFGTGESPTPFQETTVICKAGQSVTQQIEFKNPLKDSLTVQLEMQQQQEGIFTLMMKRQRITIAPQSSLLIPYQFSAVDIKSYKCNLVLTMNAQVKWTYPLLGLIENEEMNNVHLIQTKCRIPLVTKLNVVLDGLKSNEKVMYKITDMENLKKHLKINLHDHQIKDVTQPLSFDIRFLPYKPFKLSTELQVKVESGGLWRFKLQVNALEPQIDDIIVITSEINLLTKVSFRLTNRIEEIANFKAYFTPDSNPEFSVEPLTGLLEPHGKKGTEFKLGFKPKEYGIRKEAKLIIETDSMYWSYILKGHLPKYIPPTNVKSHGINNEIIKIPAHNNDKNFLIENMKKPNKHK
ncbi:unnamed protein product [Paramecium sonneborni]|uniref:MSP domain-containing protein n=1 Tax=Paramecium sonneborni TaxID=65129 RepID=A0A8S1KCS5_9CILI|nr:unnamed protein product [Paramecium sonneborni]